MRSFSSVFGYSPTLSENARQKPDPDQGEQKTKTEETSKPLHKALELEIAYREDPIVYNAINKKVQLMVHPSYTLVGGSHEVTYIKKFIDGLGKSGAGISWDELIWKIYLYQEIYGTVFGEIIYDKSGSMIVDLDVPDPKTMDYAKDENGNVAVDAFGKPLGYVQRLFVKQSAFGSQVTQIDQVPKGVRLQGNELFLAPHRIAVFKLNPVGAGFYGQGSIAPAYPIIKFKKNLEKQLTEAALKAGTGIMVAKVGDMNHEPTPAAMQNMIKKMAESNYQTGLAVPYHTDIMHVETKHADKFLSYLNYFLEQQITATGLPSAFATGAGEETNRSTLATQEKVLVITLKHQMKVVARAIESQIFKRIADLVKLKAIPTLTWGELPQELNEKADRLKKYSDAGLIKPTAELEKKLLEMEELPLGTPIVQKEQEQKPEIK